jgi:triosephosphate isomerase
MKGSWMVKQERHQERPCYIIGNWKMYKTIDQALQFVDEIAPLAEKTSYKVMLAAPFTSIRPLADKAKETLIAIGAQNMNDATEGAFTGEVAAIMLKDAGATFVLLGHSERRQLFGETNAFVNRKIKRALENGLQPVLCIGETFKEHEDGKREEVLECQLKECLEAVSNEAHAQIVIAYEPVWAIGTGLSASPEVVGEVSELIRRKLAALWSEKEAKQVSVLYGGSVSPQNAEGYLSTNGIDGLLIGSASLQPESFSKVIAIGQSVCAS